MSESSTINQLVCKNPNCQKQFKVIPQEQKFYELKKLPIPEHCPACRHITRMALRSERKMYKRNCDKCQKSMLSIYPMTAPYKVFCQECFWGNIG